MSDGPKLQDAMLFVIFMGLLYVAFLAPTMSKQHYLNAFLMVFIIPVFINQSLRLPRLRVSMTALLMVTMATFMWWALWSEAIPTTRERVRKMFSNFGRRTEDTAGALAIVFSGMLLATVPTYWLLKTEMWEF